MRIAELCEQIGLRFDTIRALLFGKTLTGKPAKFYSPEHKHFETKDIQLKIEKDPENSGKLFLSLNGQNISDWFRQKYQDVKQVTSHYIKTKHQAEKREKRKAKEIRYKYG